MAINDYSTLQAAIADELARADLTSVIPLFIQLAEADINRSLRNRFMQQTVSGTIDGDFAFPAALREVVTFRVYSNGAWREMRPLPPAAMERITNTTSVLGYVVINDTLGDYTGLDYVLTYIESIPALSDAAPQNWLILREPGLYLYSALAHSAPYLKDDGRLVLWATIAKAIRDGMQIEDDNARYGNGPAQMSVSPYAP